MADFNGKYLSEKYKNRKNLSDEILNQLSAGASGATIHSFIKSGPDLKSDDTHKTPTRASRRRTFGKNNHEHLLNKNGLLPQAEKETSSIAPAAYLASVLTKNIKANEVTASLTPDKNSNGASNSTSNTPISLQKNSATRQPLKRKARNDSFSYHKPAEVFRKDLISAMKIPDSTPMQPDEYWIMQDTWKMDWEKGVQVPVNPGALPKKSCCKIREVQRGDFRMPRKMIKSSPDIGDRETIDLNVLADKTCRYDLDEVDVAWLNINNDESKRLGYEALDEFRMEIIMEELETQCHENLQLAIKTKKGLGIEYDEDIVCDVCRSPDCEEGNEMVFCDGCNLCVHQACYGIVKVPTGSWLCKPCALGIRVLATCILCGKKGGAMKSTKNGQKWAHVSCALWIPEISIADPERMEPITKVSHIPSSRWALICNVCKERVGACIQCSVRNCVTAYHVTCAIENRFDMSTDYQSPNSPSAGTLSFSGMPHEQERAVIFRSFCRKHSKNCKKKLDDDVEKTEEEKRSDRQKRIEELEEDFYSLVKCDGIVNALNISVPTAMQVMEYWKLKRRANYNRPLITPKQEESSALEEAAETGLQRRLRMFTHLRQDLERVRNLCYMIGRREKMKRSSVKNMENVFLAQMRVVEQRMCHDKKFYPAVMLPTLPTFGSPQILEAAHKESELLKLTKEWGALDNSNPSTPSESTTDDKSSKSGSPSPEPAHKECEKNGLDNAKPDDTVNDSAILPVNCPSLRDKVELSPDNRANIGFGLRPKQQEMLLKKNNENKIIPAPNSIRDTNSELNNVANSVKNNSLNNTANIKTDKYNGTHKPINVEAEEQTIKIKSVSHDDSSIMGPEFSTKLATTDSDITTTVKKVLDDKNLRTRSSNKSKLKNEKVTENMPTKLKNNLCRTSPPKSPISPALSEPTQLQDEPPSKRRLRSRGSINSITNSDDQAKDVMNQSKSTLANKHEEKHKLVCTKLNNRTTAPSKEKNCESKTLETIKVHKDRGLENYDASPERNFESSPRTRQKSKNLNGETTTKNHIPENKPKEVLHSKRSKRIRNQRNSKNGDRALVPSCGQSGDFGGSSSEWDGAASDVNSVSLSGQELIDEAHHNRSRHNDSSLKWNYTDVNPAFKNSGLDVGYAASAPLMQSLKQTLSHDQDKDNSEGTSLRWVPLDGDLSGDESSLNPLSERLSHDGYRGDMDESGSESSMRHEHNRHLRQSRHRRSSNSIIPSTKSIRLETSEEEDELMMPWKTKLKNRRQLEVISNLNDIREIGSSNLNLSPGAIQKASHIVKKELQDDFPMPHSKAKNVQAVGSILQEQKFVPEIYSDYDMYSNAQTADGTNLSKSFFDDKYTQIMQRQKPFPYFKGIPQNPSNFFYTTPVFQQLHNNTISRSSIPQRIFLDKTASSATNPSPPQLPDSTLSPESSLPVSASVAVQASPMIQTTNQNPPIIHTSQVPLISKNVSNEYSSEGSNEWEVVGENNTAENNYGSDNHDRHKSKKKKKRRKKKKKKHKNKIDDNDSLESLQHHLGTKSVLSLKMPLPAEDKHKLKPMNKSSGKLLLKIDKSSLINSILESDLSTDYSSSEEFQNPETFDTLQTETNDLLTQQIAPRLKFKFTLSKPDKSTESQDSEFLSGEELGIRYTLSAVKETPKIKNKKGRPKGAKSLPDSKNSKNFDEKISIGRRSLRERKVSETPKQDDETEEKQNDNIKVIEIPQNQPDDLIRRIIKSKIREEQLRQKSLNKKRGRPRKDKHSLLIESNMIHSNIGVVKSEVMQNRLNCKSSSSSPENDNSYLPVKKTQILSTTQRPPVRHWKKRKVYEHEHEVLVSEQPTSDSTSVSETSYSNKTVASKEDNTNATANNIIGTINIQKVELKETIKEDSECTSAGQEMRVDKTESNSCEVKESETQGVTS